ncbi:hypothetical protein SPONN_657 [uncultured Candidatus Thioglobus sp.]|nr:hypothetical protein SPONN_657 [uncultured Candidatus Thioglobus sp.]
MNRKKTKSQQINSWENAEKIPVINFQFSDLWTTDYRLITTLLIILPLLIYAQVYDFVLLWDDNGAGSGHIYNPFMLNANWSSLGQLLTEHYFGMYIPVSYLLWSGVQGLADVLGVPLNSALHLANVLVHIINGLLVFVILRQFVANKWAVLVGALFFLLHPIQVEVVAWVSEFRSLLAFAFCLSALYIYLKNQTKFNFLTLFLLVLALLSKPSAVVFVLFVAAVNYFHYGLNLSKNIQKTLPFALVALFFVLVASSVQDIHSSVIIEVWQRPFAWLDSVVFYLFKLIFPYHLGASYSLSSKFISQQWWFYPLAFLPLGLGYWLWIKRKIYPILALAIGLFLAGFLPTSGLLSFSFQGYSLVTDRYLYFAMLGVALLLAMAFNKADNRFWQYCLIGVLLVFTGLSAWRQIPIWQNELQLWSHSKNYELNPQYAHSNLALELSTTGKKEQALVYLNKTIQHFHKVPVKNFANVTNASNALANRGTIFIQQKKYKKALADFNESSRLDPYNPSKYHNLINTMLRLKQCRQAFSVLAFARKNQVELPKSLPQKVRKTCKKLVKN